MNRVRIICTVMRPPSRRTILIKMLTMHFKPDYAPDNLGPTIISVISASFPENFLEGEELFRTAFDGAQDHDIDPASDGQRHKRSYMCPD